MTFGSTLANLRSERRISQAELAGIAGVAQSTVSDIESGRIDPKVSTALKLLFALGVSLVEIWYEDGEVKMRPYRGAVHTSQAELAAAVADSLAVLRGRSQLAEDRLHNQVLGALGEVTRQLTLIQAEVDRLGGIFGLLRCRNTEGR
ncbi:MAG: helix-turn-helix transcriptional regulator [Desulfotomaculales bacterium]